MNPEIPSAFAERLGVYALWFRWGVALVGAALLGLLPSTLLPYPRLPLFLLLGILVLFNLFLQRFLFTPPLSETTREHRPGNLLRFKPLVDLGDSLLLCATLYFTGGALSPFFPIVPLFFLTTSLVYTFKKRALLFLVLTILLGLLHLLQRSAPQTFLPVSGTYPKGFIFLSQWGFLILSFLLSGIAQRGITRFLSEMDARKRQIRGIEEFMNRLFDLLPLGLVVSTPGGEILHANSFARELLKIGSDYFQNLLRLRVVESSGLSSYLEELFRGNPLDINDYPLLHPERGKIWLRVVGIPSTHAQPQTVFLFFDVTSDVERREHERTVQQKIMEAEKFTTLGQLAAGVAHELNNPLTMVAGTLQYLNYCQEHQKLTPELLKQKFTEMEQQIERIGELLKNLLQYARPQRGAPTPQEIQRILKEIRILCNYALQKANLNLVIEAEEDLPPLLGYRTELEQILVNLLTNAIDATVKAGSTDPVHLRVMKGVGNQGEEELIFEIRDRGTGIPPEVRPHLFEPFFTTKGDQGTGLGLAIVQGIVGRYRGRIEVFDNPEGKGTVFRVILPYLKEYPEFSPVLSESRFLSA